jgi:hypothetical protein
VGSSSEMKRDEMEQLHAEAGYGPATLGMGALGRLIVKTKVGVWRGVG